uniref:GCF C-terminal domain-containing protein n=1 Tax=Rodentolepis nana TaxID=102285 RepID=A0A0R3TIH3_RODNA
LIWQTLPFLERTFMAWWNRRSTEAASIFPRVVHLVWCQIRSSWNYQTAELYLHIAATVL